MLLNWILLATAGFASAGALYHVPGEKDWSCTTAVENGVATGLLGTEAMVGVCSEVPAKWSHGISATYSDGVLGGMAYETSAGQDVSQHFANFDYEGARDWFASFVVSSNASAPQESAWIVQSVAIKTEWIRCDRDAANRWLQQNSDDPRTERIRQMLEIRSRTSSVPEPGTAVLFSVGVILALRRRRCLSGGFTTV